MQTLAKCGCKIIGKKADGTPLAQCEVINFRYYGGKCASDDRDPERDHALFISKATSYAGEPSE